MKKPKPKKALVIAIGVKTKAKPRAKGTKSAPKRTQTGNDYGLGDMGGGKVSDRGRK